MKLPNLPPTGNKAFDAYMQLLHKGLQSGVSPVNMANKSKRREVVVVLGGLAGGESKRVYRAGQPMILEGAWLVSSVATSGSTVGKQWRVQVSKARSGVLLNDTGQATNGNEILADVAWSLGTFGQALGEGDILVVGFFKDALATSLAAANVSLFLSLLAGE